MIMRELVLVVLRLMLPSDIRRRNSRVRSVNRDLLEVISEAMELSIRVEENTTLEEPVWRKSDARHDVRRREGYLLHFGVEVGGNAVKFDDSDLVERIIVVAPYLGAVEGKRVVVADTLGHNLHRESPLREILVLDGITEISAQEIGFFSGDDLGLIDVQAQRLEMREDMELNPESFTLIVDEAEGVATVRVHVTEGGGGSIAVREDHQGLMEGLRVVENEVPDRVSVPLVGTRIAFKRVDGIRAELRVTDVENRGVNGQQIPVSLLRVKLDGKSSRITNSFSLTLFRKDT